ncbi:hypothetical protein SISNIDRAFT_389860, partial [Sistotremastrum niveocremeum HHB9708]
RSRLLSDAHESMGLRGVYAVRMNLLTRVWWPGLQDDVVWWLKSCLQCQQRQFTTVVTPPRIARPMRLFFKAYVDTMFMPPSNNFRYIVQARDSLTSYVEYRALRQETAQTLAAF